MQRIEQQVSQLLDDFEKKLDTGEVELELFTHEELILPFQRLQDSLGAAAQSFDVSQPAAQQQVFAIVLETVDEIFTPQRWQKFYRDVKDTARKWMLARHPWGAALQAELRTLDKNKYEQNRFIIFSFWGQVRRLNAPKNSKP